MSIEDNKALVRRYIEALNSQDPGSLDDLFTGDYVCHSKIQNLDGLKKALEDHFKAYDSVSFELADLIAEGDRVSTRTTIRLSGPGPERTSDSLAIFRIADGKIVESWQRSDYFF